MTMVLQFKLLENNQLKNGQLSILVSYFVLLMTQ